MSNQINSIQVINKPLPLSVEKVSKALLELLLVVTGNIRTNMDMIETYSGILIKELDKNNISKNDLSKALSNLKENGWNNSGNGYLPPIKDIISLANRQIGDVIGFEDHHSSEINFKIIVKDDCKVVYKTCYKCGSKSGFRFELDCEDHIIGSKFIQCKCGAFSSINRKEN